MSQLTRDSDLVNVAPLKLDKKISRILRSHLPRDFACEPRDVDLWKTV